MHILHVICNMHIFIIQYAYIYMHIYIYIYAYMHVYNKTIKFLSFYKHIRHSRNRGDNEVVKVDEKTFLDISCTFVEKNKFINSNKRR